MFSAYSIGKRIAGLFKPEPLVENSPELRAMVGAKLKNEKIVCCLRVEKIFYKNISSFSGETFFRVLAVLTDKNLLFLKRSSEYHQIKRFPLSSVSDCVFQSDSGKPALFVNFFDGSENRLVFSRRDPDLESVENMFARALADARQSSAPGFCGQCGKKAQSDAKFCKLCGTPLDFTASENTIGD